MIRSMTGYGQAENETAGIACKVEIKSLNSKFFELNLRLPRNWQHKELELRKELQKEIERGTVSVNINLSYKQSEDKLQPLNHEVALHYLSEIQQIAAKAHKPEAQLFTSIFDFPNLVSQKEEVNNEEEWPPVLACVRAALLEFEKFRVQEGNMLADEISKMVQAIQQLLVDIEPFEKERIVMVRERIQKEIDGLKLESVDQNRFEQELIYYIEKLDIAEEKARLQQHCKYFVEVMQEGSSGKKLGFIAQEMGREINTIGSKSNHSQMQQRVVEMKDWLEKVKEQLNNVL